MVITCRCGVPGPDVLGLLRHIIQNHDGPYADQAMRVYNAMYRVEVVEEWTPKSVSTWVGGVGFSQRPNPLGFVPFKVLEKTYAP